MEVSNRSERLQSLFHAALEHGSGYLDWACHDDEALKREVIELVASFKEWSHLLPPAQAAPLPAFGPYQCDSLLGSGGMGTVYRAHRNDGEYHQHVAVKVLRGSLRSDWFRQRFLAEREILASLSHPGIARLLDGGTANDGEPYLVMELVDGHPIDQYCASHQLAQMERLQLFRQVLASVDYAHRNLVVHRDLKPANILVTQEGVTKLLDFGLAKLTEGDAATSLHALTPRYASPEQLRRAPLTPASDVYSLGIILHELLTGASPFNEMNEWELALQRASGEVQIHPTPGLTKDLTLIITKALDPSPERRYPSVRDFDGDLERFCQGRPVLARPNTFLYRAAKFANRHRTAVAATALLICVLAVGIASTLWQARKAQQRFNELRSFARFVLTDLHRGLQNLPGSTELQRRSVEQSLVYMDRLSSAAGNDDSLRLEIADGYRRLADVLGNPYRPNLGDRQRAQQLYTKALALARAVSISPASRRVAAEIEIQLAGTLGFGGAKGSGLDTIRTSAIELRSLSEAAPSDAGLRLTAANASEVLGTRLVAGGGVTENFHAAEASVAFNDSLSLAKDLAQGNSQAREEALLQMARSETNLGQLHGSEKPLLAREHHLRALAWLDRLPANTRPVGARIRARVLSNVGWAEGQLGEYSQAVKHLTESAQLLDRLSAMDPNESNLLYGRSAAYRALGIVDEYRNQPADAIVHFRIAASLHEDLLKLDPTNVNYRFMRAENLVRAGNGWAALGKTGEALPLIRDGLNTMRQLASVPNPSLTHLFGACRWLAESKASTLRDGPAAARFCQLAKTATGGSDPDAFSGLGKALLLMGDRRGALRELEHSLTLLPPAHPNQPKSRQRIELEAELARLRGRSP